MMFLPYHLRITWWHRGIVVADLVLIVVMTYRSFFPRGVRKAPLMLGALGRKPRWVTAMAFCVVLAVVLAPLADWLSFRQGRWAGEPRASSFEEWRQWMAGAPPTLPDVNPDYAATEKDLVFGLFPDRLRLPDESIVGKERLEKTKEEIASRSGWRGEEDFVPTIRLDDRDLQAAELSGADLRGVSLSAAVMQGANLQRARLDGASLVGAHLRGAGLAQVQLKGSVLFGASLQGAYFWRAQLQGADLSEAQLQGANLSEAQLQGADIVSAQLQGADLVDAQLQGTDFEHAQLQGANFFMRSWRVPFSSARSCRGPTSRTRTC